MHIAICDDEMYFREILRKELDCFAKDRTMTFVIHEFADGTELLNTKIAFDIIFLDYQMKDRNGIDTVDTLRKRNDNTIVIFVSSYQEIVFESMKYKTFRFLVKPLDKEKLIEAVNAVIKEKQDLTSISVKDEINQKSVTIPAAEIIYAQAENIYAAVVTNKGTYKYQHKISKLEEELNCGYFFKTNRSYLVNFNFVESYNAKEITLTNGHKALISKPRYKSFKQAYLTYLKNKSLG